MERENVEFRQRRYRNSSAQFGCPGVRGMRGVPKVEKKKKIKIWQTNCGNVIVEIGKKNCNNCGNGIAENGGKKKEKKKSGSEIYGRVKKKCVLSTIFL